MRILTERLKMKNADPLLIEFSSLFNKQRKSVPLHIKVAFRETLEVFLENPHHEALRRHFLKEKYAGYQSIDVTSDYRAVFKETKIKTQIIITFYTIGTHEELYDK